MDAELLIVGAGPAGCSTALHLVQHDPAWADRLLIIDRAEFPRDKVCGGGITYFGYQTLERLRLAEPRCFPAREARAHFRSRAFSFFGEPTIRIVARDVFDHWLLGQVEGAGVRVRQGVTLDHVVVGPDGVEAATDRGVLRAHAIVGADGALSRVRRSLEWPQDLPLARTLEVITPVDPDADPDYREHRLSLDFSAVTSHRLQGYTWSFPMTLDGRPAVNRGVFDSRVWPARPRPRLKHVLAAAVARSGYRLDDLELLSAPIRWWDGRTPVAAERVLLAGDAAGTDPLIGEGIAFALGHGAVAAACLTEGFGCGDLSFANYRERLLEHPVVRQIPTRMAIARIGYRLRSPLLLGAIWTLVGALVRNLDVAERAWRLFARAHRLVSRAR